MFAPYSQKRKQGGILRIINVLKYGEDHRFVPGEICMDERNGRFRKNALPGEPVIDGKGAYAIPGLIDLHFHGCMGDDLCDAGEETIMRMAAYEAENGVTTICPATMSVPEENLHQIMKAASSYAKKPRRDACARFAGIHMEGPFINRKKKGAQAAENIRPCDLALFLGLQKEAGGLIRLVDLAPETEGAMEFIDAVKAQVTVSLAHTDSDYATAMEAFSHGASHVTHLFNAMPDFHHRNPGVIGAAADTKDCLVELICDGIHVHPAAVRAAFLLFGEERIIFISDSMRAAGLSDGIYTLGGQRVSVHGKRALLSDGTIAGSVTNLMDGMKNAITEMHIPLEAAIACATENPAKELGIFDCCGSITPGKYADLVLLDETFNLQSVYLGGKRVKVS